VIPARAYETLLVAQAGGVVTVTLNRPERRNAIGPQMSSELLYVIADAEADGEARSIVLTGAGKAFCAGGDFAQMASGSFEPSLTIRGDYADLLLAMVRSSVPIVARVNGHAMGGGLGLVAASTFAVAADGAQLGTPEVDVGLFPMMIMAVLSRLVTRRRLLEMMLFGERFSADEAARIGLVNRVVPPGQLDEAVAEITAKIASKSPSTLRLGLDAFARQDDLTIAEALPMLRERLGAVLATDDAREGLTAFLEKRAPRWTGKLFPGGDSHMNMRELVAQLEERREKIRQMGGPDKVAKQHARGKLTARERLAAFFDDGVFFEVGMHGTQMGLSAGDGGKDKPPADAVVCGFGKVNGRMVCSAAYDFTVKGGSIGHTGEEKVTRMRRMALTGRWPMVWFIDSAGARIDPGAGSEDMISLFAASGHLFREQVHMSGVVPQVAAMVGPGAAGTAYIPALADFVPMVKGIGSMALGGPLLVKAVTGQEIGEQELGGSKVHAEVSGVGDCEVPDDAACIALMKKYLGYFPSSCDDPPPDVPCSDPVERRDEALLDLLPESGRKPYDMYKLIKLLVDDGDYLDMKPRFARNIITCLARVGGRSVGVVANQPMYLGGILDNDSSDKAARFIQICDAFNIPLVFLVDVPGFMVGSKVEHAGIIRHGAKMLHAMAAATVPKITVVVRKAYGAGYYVMAGRAFEPDLLVSWPSAEISVMGAEGMVGIAARKLFGDADPPPEVRKTIVDQIQKYIDIYKVAGWGYVDDVIDPRDTRRAIAWGLELSRHKTIERPGRKRGILPV
jgi:methylmalonyl-CoA decarboxylase subunit alpha